MIRFSYAAWSEPTVTPPDGNAAAPLTISSAAQNKTGPLSISSVTAYTAPGAYAPIYYDSNNTSYYIQPSNTGTSAVFAGNVGIGTTSPGSKLDVNGNVNVSGLGNAYTLNDRSDLGMSGNDNYSLSLNAPEGITINIDSNNNGTSTPFSIRTGGIGPTGGTALMTVLSDGNVGIGTTNPGAKLEVAGPPIIWAASANDGTLMQLRDSTGGSNLATFRGTTSGVIFGLHSQNYGDIYIKDTSDNVLFYGKNGGNVGIGTTSPQALLTLQKAESNTAGSGGGLGYQASNGGIWHTQRMNTSHTLIWDDYNGSSWVTGLTQTNSGNVGIGTTNPQYTLSIPVTSGIIGAYSDSTHYGSITFYDSGGFMTFDHLWSGDAGGYRFQNAGTTNLFTILGSGNVGIGTTSPGAKLDVIGASTGNGVTIRAGGGGDVVLASGGSLFFDDNYSYSSGNYIRPLAVNTQAFFTSGNERMRITSAGNIGIGTTSPDQKLTVAGTIHSTTGGIEFPDGTTQTTAAGGSSYVSGGHYGYYAYDICGCSDIYIAPMTTSYTCPAGFTYETTGSAPGSYTCGPCGQYVYWATCVKN